VLILSDQLRSTINQKELDKPMKNNNDNNIPTIELTTAQFLKELAAKGGKPLYTLSPKQAREVLNTIQAGPVEKLPAKTQDVATEWGTVGNINLRIIRPLESKGILPVILYFHGGGWILGNENTHDRLVRALAIGSNAAVVFVKYTLSPEAQYPVALEQGYAALNYLVQNARTLNLDTSKIVVAGDSVGGNMATALTMLVKERKGPKITFQLLFYPVTNADFTTPSYQKYAQGPWLTKAAMEWFWDAYAPDKEARKNPLISPLQATLQQLKNLPPALIITDENDVLRDEGEAYAHKLMQAGVRVKSMRCLGTIHDFLMLNALANTPAAKEAMDLAVTTLRHVFSQE
jgi:acetyl esterase